MLWKYFSFRIAKLIKSLHKIRLVRYFEGKIVNNHSGRTERERKVHIYKAKTVFFASIHDSIIIQHLVVYKTIDNKTYVIHKQMACFVLEKKRSIQKCNKFTAWLLYERHNVNSRNLSRRENVCLIIDECLNISNASREDLSFWPPFFASSANV